MFEKGFGDPGLIFHKELIKVDWNILIAFVHEWSLFERIKSSPSSMIRRKHQFCSNSESIFSH